MPDRFPQSQLPRPARRGVYLVEAAVCMLLIASVLAGCLQLQKYIHQSETERWRSLCLRQQMHNLADRLQAIPVDQLSAQASQLEAIEDERWQVRITPTTHRVSGVVGTRVRIEVTDAAGLQTHHEIWRFDAAAPSGKTASETEEPQR